MAQHAVTGTGTGLRRELSVWQAVGLSLALMAPSMAANINPQGTAGTVGRAVPLAFALATVGVLLIAYTFVRLCQRFHHAGSVYGFVGATLGARTGVVAGWSLLGTYVFYGVVTSTAAGIFGAAALDSLGIWTNQPGWAGFLIAAIALLGVLALAVVPARGGTRVLLTIEGATVALIIVVSVIILVRLATGTAPGGHTVDLSVFSVAPGTDVSAVFLGVVFGFLSFAGFEAAATLGEEAKDPRRSIPRAILGTAIFGGVYFVFVTAVEVMGFGTDDAGVKAFTASSSLLGDLGTQYVAAWIGDLITIGAAISAFGCALACAVGAARLLFALARDGVAPTGLAEVSASRGTPARATVVVVIGMYIVIAMAWFVFGGAPFDLFVASGTIGTLILLVAYALATIGAARLLFFQGRHEVAMWEVVIPVLALVLVAYTLFRNVDPYPAGAAGLYPAVSAAWIVVGIVIVLARPAAARRAGQQLTVSEGLA
ncbi:APC family permease [Pseudonocardia sp.]|jgi:amino acid transporter|uniref:APC family permease n=1 Tax=Pseudonocardia sp. TaxID=60912 RepID=UPI0026058690|nr:APC family permease [Pseudonocardia sp.]MCW2716416.1 Amino acid permease-associated region [Pseudonocardia sp.]